MPFDTSNLPINGGLIVGIALYAGASVLAGQVIGTRTIEKSDWPARCEAGIRAEINERRGPAPVAPKTDCHSMLGWAHPELNKLCWHFGNPDLAGPMAEATREADRRRHELRERQLARAAAGAESRCSCAAVIYTRENMLPLAVYAGSARMISLPAVDQMDGELWKSLGAPACAALTEVRP